jgi:hypothetical protein
MITHEFIRYKSPTMKLICLLPALLLLAFAAPPAAALDTADTGWKVEQRCVGEPTAPPKGWTFPGAILMTGHYGIHAVSADIATPYVVAFIPREPRYGVITLDGVLSPDQRWYATAEADIHPSGLRSSELSVYKIVIYSTVSAHKEYEMNWENSYEAYIRSIRWRDNSHIVYETTQTPKVGDDYSSDNAFLINPFTQEKEHWNGKLDPLPINDFFPSPDWTRAVYNQEWYDYAPDVRDDWGLFDPMNANELTSLPNLTKIYRCCMVCRLQQVHYGYRRL